MLNRALFMFLLFGIFFAQSLMAAGDYRTQDGMKAFPTLRAINLKDVGVMLYCVNDLSMVLTALHPDAKDFREGGIFLERPLKTQLLGAGKGFFTIDCDSGGSGDPSCTIFQESDGRLKKLLTIPGVRFAFPANGSIYVDGHNNTMFNQRKKFEWKEGSFVEVKQPFRYVGLETTTREITSIYSASDLKQAVAVLPKDSQVSILVNDGDKYLLKTPFGLVGWIQITDGLQQEASPINGIYYAGD